MTTNIQQQSTDPQSNGGLDFCESKVWLSKLLGERDYITSSIEELELMTPQSKPLLSFGILP